MKQRLGNFNLLEPIDPGGFTVVYRAEEEMGHGITRPAAVKILQGWPPDDEESMGQLRREVEMLLAVGSSPNIVTVYGFGIDPEVGPWIAMELAGHSLRHFITDEPADPDQVRLLLRDTLRALSVVHSVEPPILHRDIKPNNVLCTRFDTWMVSDFGIAKRADSEETLAVMTVQYAAPELLDGTIGPETSKMDLYSLGMVAYEYALGRTRYRQQFPSIYDPHAPHAEAGTDDRPKWMYWHTSMQMTLPPLAELIEGFPQDLSDLVAAMMAKPLRERLESADLALKKIGDVTVRVISPEDELAAGVDDDGGGLTRTLGALAVAVVLVVVLGALGVFAYFQLMPRTEVVLVGTGTYSNSQPAVLVTGTINRFPDAGAAVVRLPGGAEFPAVVDDEGSFSSQVRLQRLGESDAFLEVSDRGGRTVARKILRVERTAPETVELVVSTRPSVSSAEVMVLVRADPDNPIRLHTDADGTARTPVAYGSFDLEVRHPRFRTLTGTSSTGIGPLKTMTATLVMLSRQALEERRQSLLDEALRLAECGARGDPACCRRLEEIKVELGQLVEGPDADVDRVSMLIDRICAGDASAVDELSNTVHEIRTRDEGRPTDQDRVGGPPLTREGQLEQQKDRLEAEKRRLEEEQARLREECDRLARCCDEGDPDCCAELEDCNERLEEIARQIERVDKQIDDVRREQDQIKADKALQERENEIKRRLARLCPGGSMAPDADPALVEEYNALKEEEKIINALKKGGVITGEDSIKYLNLATLLQLTPEQLRAFIEANVPSGALSVETVPPLTTVRVRGPVFNDLERERLFLRLAPAMPRLQMEINVNPWAVCRGLEENLVLRGARGVRVHAHLWETDNVMYVQFQRDDELDEDDLTTAAQTYVIARDLLFIRSYAQP